MLQFFAIGVSAFQIAGGMLLGASGLKMLNAKDPGDSYEKPVTPLAWMRDR